MGQSGGGDKSIFSEAGRGINSTFKKWSNDPADEITKLLSTVFTAGTAKYSSKDGKWSQGPYTKQFDEGVGEIGGRNKSRAALQVSNRKVDDEKAQRKIDMDNELLQEYRSDVNASRSAQGMRDTAMSRSRQGLKSPLAPDEDLLGV